MHQCRINILNKYTLVAITYTQQIFQIKKQTDQKRHTPEKRNNSLLCIKKMNLKNSVCLSNLSYNWYIKHTSKQMKKKQETDRFRCFYKFTLKNVWTFLISQANREISMFSKTSLCQLLYAAAAAANIEIYSISLRFLSPSSFFRLQTRRKP